ncbi:hypothetical protein FRC17_010549 [Serendipita sp. 399]|nr:hypothetical protein FRC17_010549 [Serendipita sp. 399]
MEAVESGTRRGWRHLAVAKPVENKPSVFSVFKDIWINAKVLPPNIRRICTVQFFSWIGWFPVLLLSTVYVGEIYTLSLPPGGINLSTTEDATLVGASALFNSSLLSLGTIILLPLIVGYFKKRSPRRAGFHFGLAEIWILSQLLFSACMGATWFTGTSVTGSINILALTGFSFAVTQWVPFGLLAEQISGGGGNDADADVDAAYRPLAVEGDQAESIPIRRSERWTTPDTGLTPRIVFDSEEGSGSRDHGSGTALGTGDERARLMERPQENRGEDDPQLIKNLETSEYAVGSPYAGLPTTANRNGSDVPTKLTNISGKAGVILGIHSASIVIPQFLVTTLSSIIFASYEPVSGVHPGAGHAGAGVGRGAVVGPRAVINDGGIETNKRDTIGRLAVRALESTLLKRSQGVPTYYASGNGIKRPDGIALIFKIGGCSSLIAAFLCWRLARELRRRRIS